MGDLAQMMKYPSIVDYRQSIVELDEKEFINLKLVLYPAWFMYK